MSERLLAHLGAVTNATRCNTAETRWSERQAQIVDVAMRLLATQGARKFTVQALATEVGVTGGAIYRHFDSMESVVDAIVEKIETVLFRGFPPSAPDPIERLRQFFFARAEAILSHPDVSRLLLLDHLGQICGPLCARRLQEFKQKTRTFLMSCLREAEANGQLSSDVTPEACAIVLTGTIQSLSQTATRQDPGAHTSTDQVWSAIERMLRGTAEPQPNERLTKTAATLKHTRAASAKS